MNNKLMKSYLASLDFDGTLRVDDMEKETIELLSSLPPNIICVINTGRGIKILQDKVNLYYKDHYDTFMNSISYFICNNGTDIYYWSNNKLDILQEWSEYLNDQWEKEQILKCLTPLAENHSFDLYPEDYNYKYLYYFLRPNFDEAEEVISIFRDAIKDFPISLVYAKSSQKAPDGLLRFVCEIFPKKAGKGNALIFLKNYLDGKNISTDAIACFGDDRNDLQTIIDMPLIYEWWYGCLVGNSTDWIIDKANSVLPDIKGEIIIAPKEFPGPLGIKWIMQNLNWIQ
jgi:HAD superfamily hydrolase (TIGR01484 family)